MPKRMNPKLLRPELRSPEGHQLMVAFQNMIAGRVRAVEAYRAEGTTGMTLLDATINITVYVWSEHGGTRQQTLINNLHAPRSTIMDSLRRLEGYGYIVRAANGAYHATDKSAHFANRRLDDLVREMGLACDAFLEYRKAYPNNSRKPAL